jgi:hypothetical protein
MVYTLIYDETPQACGLTADSPLFYLYEAVGQRPGIAAYIKGWKARKIINASL